MARLTRGQDAARQITNAKEATRSRERLLKGQDMFAGHTLDEMAGRAQPQSSMLSLDLPDNEAEEEKVEDNLSQCGQKRTRGGGTRWEMGITLEKMDGPKQQN